MTASTALPTLDNFNPFDPAALSCPHAGWSMLRREAPIYRMNLPDVPVPVYMVTRKQELEYIVRDPQLFSNHPVPNVWRWGEFEGEIAKSFNKCGRKVVFTLATSDPPESSEYRRIAERWLNRHEVEQTLQPEIEAIIDRQLAAMPEGEMFDFVEAFSVPLPLLVICLILGVPYKDVDFMRKFSDEFAVLVDPAYPTARAAKAADTVADGYMYLERYVDQYRRQPAHNLLSDIANENIYDRPVTTEEALSMAHNLTIAGNETTRNALSSAMFWLVRKPALWRQLQADPTRIADFVEEVIRVDAPAVTTARQVMRDTEINGIAIPKGACLFLMWGSVSNDEQMFPDPTELDIDRRNKRAHYSFGMGLHHCVGHFLARAEVHTAVTRWLEEFESVELAQSAEEIHYAPIFGFRALEKLPLRIKRRATR